MASTILILGFAKVFRLVEFPSFDRNLPGKVGESPVFRNDDVNHYIIVRHHKIIHDDDNPYVLMNIIVSMWMRIMIIIII